MLAQLRCHLFDGHTRVFTHEQKQPLKHGFSFVRYTDIYTVVYDDIIFESKCIIKCLGDHAEHELDKVRAISFLIGVGKHVVVFFLSLLDQRLDGQPCKERIPSA